MRFTFLMMPVLVFIFATGCGVGTPQPMPDPDDPAAGETIPFTRLKAVPPDLQFVIDHREQFGIETHPLRDVIPGTLMEDLSVAVSGCWGRLTEEMNRGIEPYELAMAEVLKLDCASHIAQVQSIRNLDGTGTGWVAIEGFEGNAALSVGDYLLAPCDEFQNRLIRQGIDSDASLLLDHGRIDVNDYWFSVAQTGPTAGLPLSELVTTLSSDALITAWPVIRFPEGDEKLEDVRHWVRFDCAEEGVQHLRDSPSWVEPNDLDGLSEDLIDAFFEDLEEFEGGDGLP